MKILLFSDQYYPMGGAIEQYIRFLSKEFSQKGHSVTILTRAIDGQPDSSIENGISIIRKSELNNVISNPGKAARRWRKLAKTVRDIDPSVIYANHHSSLMAIELGKFLAIPVVYGCHGWGLLCPLKIRLMKPDGTLCHNERSVANCRNCFDQMKKKNRGFVGALKEVKHGIIKTAVIPRKVERFNRQEKSINSAAARIGNSNLTSSLFTDMKTVYLGVDTKIYFKQSSGTFCERFNIKSPFILVPGRLNNIKGQEWAIRALQYLPAEYSIVIAGTSRLFSGPEDETNAYLVYLKKLISEQGFGSRTVFTGLLEQGDMIQAYSSALATVVPSVWLESFGYVTAEAMACECPVIVSENCGSAELVSNGDDGFVVPRMDAEAIAEAVKKIARDRNALGLSARKTIVEKLNWSRIADQVLDVLSQTVKSGTQLN